MISFPTKKGYILVNPKLIKWVSVEENEDSSYEVRIQFDEGNMLRFKFDDKEDLKSLNTKLNVQDIVACSVHS